jgi:hypothetical protein
MAPEMPFRSPRHPLLDAKLDADFELAPRKCQFVNLLEKEEARWGQGFTAEKMKQDIGLLLASSLVLGFIGRRTSQVNLGFCKPSLIPCFGNLQHSPYTTVDPAESRDGQRGAFHLIRGWLCE